MRAVALLVTETIMGKGKGKRGKRTGFPLQFHPSSLSLPLRLPHSRPLPLPLPLLLLVLLLLPGLSSPTVAQTVSSFAVNCGSSQSFNDITSNRTWEADWLSNTQIGIPASSQNPSGSIKNAKEDEQVYRSARIFTSEANYTLSCVAGTPYFLRLFFNAFANPNTSQSLLTGVFSVAVGDVNLLSNWSISGEVDGREDSAHMREYGTACPASSVMFLHLVPAVGSFAFINGFELFPIPDTLYRNLTSAGYTFFTYYRWNCGGSAIPSENDLVRRRWAPDLPPVQGTEYTTPDNVDGSNEAPTFTPAAVFKSSRQAPAPLAYNLVVERGASYFVRLFFAELKFRASFQRVMTVQINGGIRLQKLDVYYSAGSGGMFLDFFPIDQPWERRNISIMLQEEASSMTDMMAINGLEVLKIGTNNLSATERVRVTDDGAVATVGSRDDLRNLQAFIAAAPGNQAVLSDWTSARDVCAWTGVECQASTGVVGLDLSAYSPRLRGRIPEEIGGLTSLKRLVLSNQSFEGPIPTALGILPELEILLLNDNLLTGAIPIELATGGKLQELAVQQNNLTGEVPVEVLNTVSSFTWRGGNDGLCAPVGVALNSFSLPSCGKEAGSSSGSGKPNAGTVVGIVVGSVGGCAAVLAVIFVFCLKRTSKGGHYLLDSFTGSFYSSNKSGSGGRYKSAGGLFSRTGAGMAGGKGTSVTTVLLDGTKVGQRFTIEEIGKATCQFDEARIIGMGGFGNVYRGELADGEVVAVKRGSAESLQGAREFQTEIVTLSNLRHRHLVSLIGYCDDNGEMILVYEYMAKGTLRGHLYGKGVDSETAPLSWRKRLEICIGSARGLEYLHSGAQDMVIHRDVKSTNILLDDNLIAKVADFGLSKSGPSGINETHVSTAVKGSFGYLDPAYFKTQQLTEKSDVYSFGVVLLEIVTARSPIMQGGSIPKGQQVSLADWAVPKLKAGKVEQIVDPKLVNSYGTASLHKVGEVALRCLDEDRDSRPSMADVLRGLEDALMLQDNSLSVVLEHPGAMMSTSFYNVNDSGLQDFTSASGASYPLSPPDSLLMAR
ncbi:hypothetical protein CBR_g38040 [Chara braunii]|uniref:Protein kinase domain-containing protein n=1 Tax=Chara braunii TaxID=69332 RepID=A0A388K054_CHABU|nr:hypothetical protein CBR_g38040 [Chara braunii]|eukprot:GBG63418.1 hypothetical protein CBR_g38040 [Chara braunii]